MQQLIPEGAERIATVEEVREAYARMAEAVNDRYGNQEIVLVVVMNGGLICAAHLAERLGMPVLFDYLHVSRYRGETRGDALHWIARPQQDLRDRHVLIVDDILDEGPTLGAILQYCQDAGAATVAAAVLVEKSHGRRVPGVNADFVGLQVPDRYVFGCGMDLREGLRHLPDIWALSE